MLLPGLNFSQHNKIGINTAKFTIAPLSFLLHTYKAILMTRI